MNCDRCKKEDSSVHLTEIIKNVRSEIHLCENCAKEIGLNSKLTSFSLSLPDMLSFLDVEDIENSGYTESCKFCGHSIFEFKKTGLLGCPDCYSSMSEIIDNTLLSKYDTIQHQGKIPTNTSDNSLSETNVNPEEPQNRNLEWLNERMSDAITKENYEEAARLRDIIKSLSLVETKS